MPISNGTVQNRTTNDENQLTNIGAATLTYDDNGNLTTDDSGYTLKYDAWNRLVSAKNGTLTLVSFAYDGQGWRTQESASGTTTDLYYTASWQIAETRVSVSYGNAGTVQSQNVWSPVYVNALILRDRDTDANGSLDERLYFTSDANYDVTSVINTSGAVQEHVVYTSYGTAAFADASWNSTSDSKSLRTLWQGGNWNSWINSYDFQRRFYSPSLMRWTTADPIGYGDGANMYQGEVDDPIDRVDPQGTKKVVILFEGLMVNFFGLGSSPWVDIYWRKSISKLPGVDVQYYHRTDEPKALEYITKNYVKDKTCKDTIIIAGFSFGGDAAIKLANDLKNIPVYAGFTVDPRWQSDSMFGTPGDKGLRPFDKPKNALIWSNTYQHSSGFPGNEVNGSSNGQWFEHGFALFVKPTNVVDNPADSEADAFNHAHERGYIVYLETDNLINLIKSAPDSR